MEPLLSVDNVSMIFGGLRAVDDLTMHIEKGKIYALIGPNGAGKTTALNVVSGFYKPTKGTVRFDGKAIQGLPSNVISQRGIAKTFQNLRLFKEMTALENVQVGMHNKISENAVDILFRTHGFRASEERSAKKAREYLDLVGLADKAGIRARHLPYGQQKVLEIARALAQEPQLLLLDEPVAGLNDTETAELSKIVRQIQGSGITVLMIEHDMRFVVSLSDWITVLNFGKKIAEGEPMDVIKRSEVVEAYLGGNAKYD